MWGEVRDAQNDGGGQMSDAELAQSEAAARVMVQQAVFTAKGQGTMPASLARLVEATLKPRIPWAEILGRFLEGNCKQDYSWMRPNECYLAQGIIYPGLYSPAQATVVFAADTSGSVSQGELREVCTEIIGALELYQDRGEPVELPMLWCDAKVYPQTLTSADDILRPEGGGGTSFAPVFEYVDQEGLTPRALVYATDGYCSNFGPTPPYPVLWMLTRRGCKDFRPPFGEVAWTMNN
jgi:predicted metal-dependent peptidase